MPRRLRRVGLAVAVGLALVSAAGAARADGRIEINQAAALAGGVTPGDSPGFPVTLNRSGSYLLTSDLVPGQSVAAIDLQEQSITLDLNGFSLRGPSPLGGVASGIVGTAVFFPPNEVTIRNGVIRGFRGRGIDLGSRIRILVEDLLVYGNEQGGLALGGHGTVRRTRARGNGLFGFQLGEGTAFEDCSVTGTTGGPDVSGGLQVGGSFCEDGSCSPKPAPRYYITIQKYTGSQAPGACAAGFHFASLWEIHDPTGLRYDASLGVDFVDSGSGPPRGQSLTLNQSSYGWVRTGEIALSDGSVGSANCDGWLSSSGADAGTIVSLTSDWDPPGIGLLGENQIAPWEALERACNDDNHVWCVED